MRKLKLQMQLSVDGFVSGINGEMDWMISDWDAQLKQYVTELTAPVDLILLGRKLAQGFIPFWASNPDLEGAEKINSTKKLVFTKTITAPDWANTTITANDLVTEVSKLKTQAGGDIIVYGGAGFVSSLIREGLIDDYYFFINPVILGSGMPIFDKLDYRQDLKPVQSTSFACGVTCLHYRKK